MDEKDYDLKEKCYDVLERAKYNNKVDEETYDYLERAFFDAERGKHLTWQECWDEYFKYWNKKLKRRAYDEY